MGSLNASLKSTETSDEFSTAYNPKVMSRYPSEEIDNDTYYYEKNRKKRQFLEVNRN